MTSANSGGGAIVVSLATGACRDAVRVYRWQDPEGRGPYVPGISLYWKDADHEARNPSMQHEFGWDHLLKDRNPREHMGCAFRRPEQMRDWFTQAEQDRMRFLGYQFGSMLADRIVVESARQLVFVRRRPLREGFELETADAPQ